MATQVDITLKTENKTLAVTINGEVIENVIGIAIDKYEDTYYCTVYTSETDGEVRKSTHFSVKANEVQIVSASKVEHDIQHFLRK